MTYIFNLNKNFKANTQVNFQSGTTYTLALTDRSSIVAMTSGSANTVTIPTNASVAFPVGTTITIVQRGTGITTIQGTTGVSLNTAGGGSKATTGQYQGIAIYKESTDSWIALNK